jgi:large subunit ribosomal protein L24
MLKFKINDKVMILSGKDKCKIGIIKKQFVKKKQVLIEGINFSKKNIKANPNKNKEGGIINIEKPISTSKIILINPQTNKKDKIFFSYENKKKIRIFKSNKEFLK